MTVRAERVFHVAAPIEEVWEFLVDPARRAEPISVVDDFESTEDGATWHVSLPIPIIDRTIAVETHDVKRDPPRYVEFVGRSRAFSVTGTHELDATEGGTRVTNRFVVEGRLPGVERFFQRRLDEELKNLEDAIEAAVGEASRKQ
jgi:carbon monoxide dehydrogenase subunit G